MAKGTGKRKFQKIIFLILLIAVTSSLMYLTLVYLTPAAFTDSDLKVGDAAPLDILAPYAINYTSDVLTEQMRELAVHNVSPRYTTADTSVARQQLEQLRAALAYISSVRADPFASTEQKLADLAALGNISLSQEAAAGILELNETRWQTIKQEAIVVLEQVMRNTIRDNQVETRRSSVPNMVSLSLPEEHTAIVAELVAAFIVPNSFYSEGLTKTAEQEAADAVEPVTVSYAAGETIVERGEIVTETDIEALQQLGLAEPETQWQDHASAGGLVVLSISLMIIYLRRKPALTNNPRDLFLIAFLFIAFLAVGRLLLPVHALMPYVYPLAAYALIISGLYGTQPALVSVIPLIILTTFGQANAYELLLYYGISSIFGVLIPRREQRITAYIWVGLTTAVSGALVISIVRLSGDENDLLELAALGAIALLNGIIAAGLTVLLQFLLAPVIGQTTPLQLLELSRPDHPLLEFLLHNAPGTYQHSLQVANLAEQAAERIDADSLLTRVGALYHDIGKAQNAQFFVENQIPGQLDTHENLEPEKSATIIRDHVIEGLRLAKKHRLPRRIQDFITEHHGTNKTYYQWTQAVKNAGGDPKMVNEEDFKYIGPRPQSKETALVMLADGCEARVRANRPDSEEKLREMIKEMTDKILASGQLDDTPLTLQNLATVVDSFTATLRGAYHPRVEYPSLDTPTKPIAQINQDAAQSQVLSQPEEPDLSADPQPSHDLS